MHRFVIRPATPEDSKAVAAIAESAYDHYVALMNRKPAPMTEDYETRIADDQVHVLESTDGDVESVQGFLVLEPGDGCMLLDNVALAPEMQGRGYGKALICYAVEKAKASGFEKLTLYTNEVMVENIRLYSRLGFVETHRANEKGFNRVFMTKSLL